MFARLLGYLLAVFRFLIFIITTLIMIVVHQAYYLFTKDFMTIAKWYHGFCLKLFGIRVKIIGQRPEKDKQYLFLSNHLSHMDIIVLGSILDTVFVSKDDVAKWPIFGLLAKLQKTVFIARTKAGLQNAKTMIEERTKIGQSLVLFPEGTSTRGNGVYPFKSSLISVFENIENKPIVQPIVIKHVRLNGQDVTTNDQRDTYAWHIEDDLAIHEHLWRMAQQPSFVIEVHFLETLSLEDFEDRKVFTANIEQKIRNVVEA